MSETDDTKSQIRSVVQQHIHTQGLNPENVAAISALCDRLVQQDRANGAFVQEMISLSRQGADAARQQGQDSTPWSAMERILGESLPPARPAEASGLTQGRY